MTSRKFDPYPLCHTKKAIFLKPLYLAYTHPPPLTVDYFEQFCAISKVPMHSGLKPYPIG